MSTVANTNSFTSVRGLNAVYTALDNHQYTRCIKLCQQILSQQPTAAPTIVSALLAHAYAKSGQRYKAVATIQGIFGTSVFPELQLFLKYARFEKELVESNATTAPAAPPVTAQPSKKGGKKKSLASMTVAVETKAESTSSWDWSDQLVTPPRLPDDWEQCIPNTVDCLIYQDSNLMATLSLTLVNVLRLPLTAYQLYAWALSALETTPADPSVLQQQFVYAVKAYLHGIAVLVGRPYETIQTTILKQLQALALHITRLQQQQRQSFRRCSMLWAAQTALWQFTLLDDPNQTRRDLLPRLAESLASKSMDLYCSPTWMAGASEENEGDEDEKHTSHLVAIESVLLYVKTLKLQEKWNLILETVQDLLMRHSQDDGRTDVPPRQTLLELKYEALQKLSINDSLSPNPEIRGTVEELLHLYPDDWVYWKQHLEASIAECQGDLSAGSLLTEAFRCTILENSCAGVNSTGQKYLLRGPNLIRVELAASRLTRNTPPSDEDVVGLMECIISYGNSFASRASCIFADLSPYFDRCLCICSVEHAHVLLQWSKELRNDPLVGPSAKERLKQLRVYIFAVQVNFKVLNTFSDLQSDELPSWEALVEVWRNFQAFENSENVDQVGLT